MKSMDKSSVAVLAEEILNTIVRPLPAVDIHTHINPFEPAARDVGDLVFYHYIVTEMETAGIDRCRLSAAKTVEEKVDLFVSSAPLVANTVTFWCLRRVLAQHGLDVEADITREALLQINQKIRGNPSRAAWPRQVLVERNNIRKTALTLNITEVLPAFDKEIFFGTLRMDDLLNGAGEKSLSQFMAVTGTSIESLSAFERAAAKRATEFAQAGGKALTAGLPPEGVFVPPDRPAAEKLFDNILHGKSLTLGDQSLLQNYLLDFFASLASDLSIPFQLLLGVRRPLPGNTAVSVLHHGLVTRFAPLFHKFSKTRFDMFLGSVAHSQELVAMAKNYSNLSLSGFWWYAFSPPYIRSMLTERLLALPVVKLHAFFSDAYNVEWSAGKLALLRKELSWVLAELIISGYVAESRTSEIAESLLSKNATRLYKL
jgi:glucuronate isomerase